MERLNRLNLKMVSPSKYFSNIIQEMDQKVSSQKEVKKQAKGIIRSQRVEHTRIGMDKMRKQMGLLEEEIDSL